jgi:hypothetical protein
MERACSLDVHLLRAASCCSVRNFVSTLFVDCVAVTDMSDTPAPAPPAWKDNEAIYPPAEEIVTAMQDLGKKHVVKQKGREVTVHKYPLVDRLAGKIYSSILALYNNPEGLTKNKTRGRQFIYKDIVQSRRHRDISETDPFFHQFGKDGKVFLITNDTRHAGIDVCIQNFQRSIEQQLMQKNTARTSQDGLRLGCILLDTQFRSSVAGIMTKRKDRKKSDIQGDPTDHFFEKILQECFSNADYVATPPSEMYLNDFPIDEVGAWDPNHPSTFEHERNTAWLRATWEEYLRPKYKKALDRWNKDTGGGDGTPLSFIDFCGGDRWLLYLFCKDIDANFLLANNAGGRIPRHLQVESGFNEDVSSLGEDVSGSASKRVVALEDELSEYKKQRKEISGAMDKLVGYLDSKKDRNQNDSMDRYIKQAADYSEKMQDQNALNTMSPDSKEVYVNALKTRRKDVLKKMTESGSS